MSYLMCKISQRAQNSMTPILIAIVEIFSPLPLTRGRCQLFGGKIKRLLETIHRLIGRTSRSTLEDIINFNNLKTRARYARGGFIGLAKELFITSPYIVCDGDTSLAAN